MTGLIRWFLRTRTNGILLKIDLFLTINNNGRPKFRIYELPITNMRLIIEYDPPDNLTTSSYHLSTFADIGRVSSTISFQTSVRLNQMRMVN